MVERLQYESDTISADVKKKRIRKKDETIEIMPGVYAPLRNVAQQYAMVFNPEDSLWIKIRRVANIVSIAGIIVLVVKVVILG